ncbi:hypothetical protein EN850_15570 [Mesorhizobium sp. M8A.F.Ca.ET.207.01.1.1]|nr:hypothetical protein EN850_15570 [Mesorhizobium sp. M8A.F.Ca.ET.207.01.1.1]
MRRALSLVRHGVFVVRTEGVRSAVVKTRRFLAERRSRTSSFSFFSNDGAVSARRPLPESDIALQIPLPVAPNAVVQNDIAVIVHVYYTDVFKEILLQLKNIESGFRLYVSTTDDEKRKSIQGICTECGIGGAEVRVFENRGRDIAPKIVGFSDVYKKHELFLHLHTKKSPHLSSLDGWREYLIQNLIGSKEIVRSILLLFASDEKLGVVYPQHFYPIREMLNWGFDFETAKALLGRAHWELSKDSVLEFPSGSMFWGRSAALAPLLDLGLTFEDFPSEAGQVDGTLAHAIERSYLHFAECAGFHWFKVQTGVGVGSARSGALLKVEKAEDPSIVEKVYLPLFEEPGRSDLLMGRQYGELRPLRISKSNKLKPRINLLLPTIDPRHIFGGISTAIKIFDEICLELVDFDKRIIVLDSPVEEGHLHGLREYALNSSDGPAVIFEAFDRRRRLDVRKDDFYMSTAWWSEYLRTSSIARFQKKAFGRRARALYFMQDYESNFVQWSSRWAIAESTYDLDESVIPLVNSEELSSFINHRFGRADQIVVPFRVNDTIRNRIRMVPKERIILCYGRPAAARNCFEIIVDGLSLWQQRNPIEASKWRVVFLGEDFDESKMWPVQNGAVPGKVSLEAYAEYLSRASVGVSLMISPHPSYPPLEMAHAGLITVSNNYDTKRISDRSGNLLSLDFVTPDSVARAVGQAVSMAEENVGITMAQTEIRELPFVGTKYDPRKIAALLKDGTAG